MNPIIERWEGFRNVCYLDTGGVATIGYGNISSVTINDVGVKRITRLEGLELLRRDLLVVEPVIMRRFPGLISNPRRFYAVTSFCFNCGLGALDGRRTAIGKNIAAEKWQEVAAGIMYWIRDNGKVIDGLVNRRVDEAITLIKG